MSIVRRCLLTFAGVSLAWLALPVLQAQRLNYPSARRSDQTDRYHGIEVADPYRWLEDANSDETKAWIKAQDELLQRHLGEISARAAIKARLTELLRNDSYTVPIKAGGRYFFVKTETGRARGQGVIYVQDSVTAQPRALLDIQKQFSADTTLITAAPITPSPDGRFLAYSLRKRQSRWIGLQIFDVEKGVDLPDVLTGQHSVSGGVSWTPNGKGFFYSAFDLPKPGNEQQAVVQNPKIFYHLLGQPQTNDRLIATLPHEPNGYFTHSVTHDGNYVIVHAHGNGSTKTRVLYQDLREPGAQLKPLLAEADAAFTFLGNDGARFFFYTDLSAPRGRIVAIDLAQPQRQRWVEVVPQMKEAINARDQTGGNALALRGNRFVLMYVQDGRPLLRVFDLRGKLRHEIPVPIGGSIWGGFSGTPRDAEVFYQYLGFSDPSTIFRLNVETGRTTLFQRAALQFDRSRYEVKQVFYPSKDGTRIPMFLIHRKGLKLDGNAPAYLYGYGGMGWISFTWFRPHLPVWLEMGGVYAQPSLRGGGEYGETWHQAGIKQNKQNVIDDYLAAAEWLVKNKYTSATKLVANGSSLSGPLASAAMQRRPDLFGASVIDIPVLDLLRFDQFTGGAYWQPEFGSPADAQEFQSLRAWSPVHNAKVGTCYPPTLVMAGELDQTAPPLHAHKFVAAVQAAQGCTAPILLKTMRGAGHNQGSTPAQIVDSYTDELGFLIRALKLAGF